MNSPDWPRRGEIWWAYTPGQPGDPHQPRPALVISVDLRNRLADDVIVIPIFSQGRAGPTRVPMLRGMGGLPHNSMLFCDEVTTISRRFLDSGPLGKRLPEEFLDLVVRAVQNAILP
jgi:mRNA-degrading endonuclease toxin of MazEF toxin-antitoxin module